MAHSGPAGLDLGEEEGLSDEVVSVLSLHEVLGEEELLLLELEPLLPGVGGHGVAEGGDVVTDVVYARLLQGHRIIQQGVGQVVHCDDHLELLFLDSGQIICSGKVLSNNLSFAILPEQNVSQ